MFYNGVHDNHDFIGGSTLIIHVNLHFRLGFNLSLLASQFVVPFFPFLTHKIVQLKVSLILDFNLKTFSKYYSLL